MAVNYCGSVYVFVAHEDLDFCQLPAGHEGKHRYVHEWTDAEAEEAEKRWQ